MKEGSKYLKKERKRKKRYYKKTKELFKKELKEQREAVKTREQKHRLFQKQTFDSTVATSSPIPQSHTPSPLIVSVSFQLKQ